MPSVQEGECKRQPLSVSLPMGVNDYSVGNADGVKHPRAWRVWHTCGDPHRMQHSVSLSGGTTLQ